MSSGDAVQPKQQADRQKRDEPQKQDHTQQLHDQAGQSGKMLADAAPEVEVRFFLWDWLTGLF
jgi:hypothetical protein